MDGEDTLQKAKLSDIQVQSIEGIVVKPFCFPAVAAAVEEFKSKISGSHSLGAGPGSLVALVRKTIDPAFHKFLSAFAEKMPQKLPSLSNLMKDGIYDADLKLCDLALLGRNRGKTIQISLTEYFERPLGADDDRDLESQIIYATVDTLRYLVSASGVFQPKQKRKSSPYGEGRKNNTRVWVASRKQSSVAPTLNPVIRQRALFREIYPFCRFCYQYCEHYQSRINTYVDSKTKCKINFLPIRDNRSDQIQPGMSQEYCEHHRLDRNARDRDRRLQPVYFALLVALYWLIEESIIPRLDEEELRELAYQEARNRGAYAKKIAFLLKQNAEISNEELGQSLAAYILQGSSRRGS